MPRLHPKSSEELSEDLEQGLAGSEPHYKHSYGYIVDPLGYSLSSCSFVAWCQIPGETRDGLKPTPSSGEEARASLWDHQEGTGGLLLLQNQPLISKSVPTLMSLHTRVRHPGHPCLQES